LCGKNGQKDIWRKRKNTQTPYIIPVGEDGEKRKSKGSRRKHNKEMKEREPQEGVEN